MARLSFPHAKTHSWKKRRRRRGFLQLMKEKRAWHSSSSSVALVAVSVAPLSPPFFRNWSFFPRHDAFGGKGNEVGCSPDIAVPFIFSARTIPGHFRLFFLLARIWNFLSPFLRESVCGVGSQITWLGAWLQEARKKHPSNNPEK